MAEAFYLTRTAMEQDRETTERTIDSILESAVDAAVLVSQEYKIMHITTGFTRLTGQSVKDYKGHSMEELKISDCSPIRRVIRTGSRLMAVNITIGGNHLLANIVPVKLEEEIIGAVLMILFSSIAVLKRAISAFDREAPDAAELYDRLSRKSGSYTFSDFVGDSPMIETLLAQCYSISHSPHPVLLMGETGVGKEILANGIFHEYSGGKALPFVKINCSAIPRDLLESELFGHEKGAFTGAVAAKKGKFELAAGGMVLLDEIGDMDLGLQSKLLRVLEEREFERIGGNRVIPLNARIIASTNQNLKKLAAEGKFRMDLYYRLNTFEISIPPLRAHREDIPKLIDHFIRLDGLHPEFSDGGYRMLLNYDWPGNVRELRNVLNRLSFLYPDGVIGEVQVYHATGEMFSYIQLPEYHSAEEPPPPPTKNLKKKDSEAVSEANGTGAVPEEDRSVSPVDFAAGENSLPPAQAYEKQLILQTLSETGMNLSKCAAILKMNRSTLYNRIKKYGIRVEKSAAVRQ